MTHSLLFAILFHAIGAFCASVCYTPQKKIVGWSWQTFWIMQAFFCWFLLPIVVAIITVPHIGLVLSEAPKSIMAGTFFMGAIYGIGGTTFAVAIRYIGYSLTYAIAVGLSAVLGTLIPPIISGSFSELYHKVGFHWIIFGIVAGTLGIGVCGIAGFMKEKDSQKITPDNIPSAGKGLLLSVIAGFCSAVYGLALDFAKPLAIISENHGAGQYAGNIIYIFTNTGAFVTAAGYSLYLHRKHGTFSELINFSSSNLSRQNFNIFLSFVTGLLWYSQFFFYNLAHSRMLNYEFISWAFHMIMLVLFSKILGILFKEWYHCEAKTKKVIYGGIALLIFAILFLTYGTAQG